MQNLSLKSLSDKWPSSIVSRTELKQFSGGALNARTVANLDSQGVGIEGGIRIGRKICYPVSSVIRFMEARTEALKPKGHAEAR